MLLQRSGDGVTARLVVRPFSTPTPQFEPGVGGAAVLTTIGPTRVQAERSLEAERAEAERLIAASPSLRSCAVTQGEWRLPTIDRALELLLDLGRSGASYEWVGGLPLRVREEVGAASLSLKFSGDGDGFDATGQLRWGDGDPLGIGTLLDLVAASPGRFVAVGAEEFIALTEAFREQLAELQALSTRRGKSVLIHGLATAALADWLPTCGSVEGDARWKRHSKALREANASEAEVPKTLRAELRPYQLDGFRWLSRLSRWGAGACLADDMGLGKTVQALALILSRAPDGPTLVVAPTSVGLNWIDEARRFAPTLRCVWLADADRESALATPAPFEVVVTSYALLLQERKALSAVRWHTIVLDEAQAIKNSAAQRTAAAMDLRGAFKMVTTGTPLENNVGELWTLFRFLNPGLLGSREHFDTRFATPVTRGDDRPAGARLARLLRPFVLRRTKAQVLPELPARTDVDLRVRLSTEEAALYEAIRREALEGLEGDGVTVTSVLAALMRLRRACCHPRLVLPDAGPSSAKLSAFAELEQELRGSGHRALVFSQFVDHLAIVRDYLDGQGVKYQYLDGSTPTAERKRRVDAFQSGDGEHFLMSLRAGGHRDQPHGRGLRDSPGPLVEPMPSRTRPATARTAWDNPAP